MECHGFDRYWNLVFGRKRNIFVWEENSLGVTNACGHPCLTSQTPHPPTMLACWSGCPRRRWGWLKENCETVNQFSQNNLNTLQMTSLCQVMRYSAESVNMMSVRNVWMHAETTCGLKSRWTHSHKKHSEFQPCKPEFSGRKLKQIS